MTTVRVQVVDALPATIRVHGYDIAIHKWDNHEAAAMRRYGEFSSIEQCIRIQRDMPSRFKAVDTMLHEIHHAAFWAYGIEEDDKEERIVCALGSAWMQIYRDNPWLLRWILEALA